MDPITAINLAVTVKSLLDSQGGKKEDQKADNTSATNPLAQLTQVLELVKGANTSESGDAELIKALGLA